MEKSCRVDGCNKPPSGAHCQMHYLRIKKYGTPHWQRPTIEQRFWARVTKTDACWLWTGRPTQRGGLWRPEHK